MKRRSIIWNRSWIHRRWEFSTLATLIILSLAIFSSATTTGFNGHQDNDIRGSSKGLESVKTIRESIASKNNNLRTGGNEEFNGVQFGTENRNNPNENNHENSPALNSFLENVLRAKDELKWIDEAVRKKESQDKTRRYERTPDRRNRAFRHRSNFRSKRFLDHGDSKDHAESPYTSSERRFVKKSPVKDEPVIDDLTLRDWTMEEGIQVPDSWFEADDQVRNTDEEIPENRWSRSQREDLIGDSSHPDGLKKNEENLGDEDSESETPTLESLKKTVLELSRSLRESDRKMEALNEREDSRNRERHVEEISGRKEGRAKGEHERDSLGRSSSRAQPELSSGPNWWDDPRSAADIFDFRKREGDDEELDDEETEEDLDPEKSEFDYPVRKMKSAREEYEANETEDVGKKPNVRIYRRSGFGESYPDFSVGYGYNSEDHGREKRSGYEKNVEEIKEISERPDKIGHVVRENDESERNKSLAANETGNDNNNSGILTAAGVKDGNNTEQSSKYGVEIKKSADDNHALVITEEEKSSGIKNSEKSGNTRADAPLISTDEERSSIKKVDSCDKGEKREPNRSSANEITFEEPPLENVHMRSDELLKNVPVETISQNDKNVNVAEKKEVEKSEPTDDAVPKLFTNDSKEEKNNDVQRVKVENESHASGVEKAKESGNFENITNVKEEKSKNIDFLGTNGRIVESREVQRELFFNNDGLDSNIIQTGRDPSIDREGSQRKLLWLSGDSKDSEIRDGRRDSAWDQKDDATKSVQRPANLIDNLSANRDLRSSKRRNLKFAKRSIKAADSLNHKLEKFKKSPKISADLSKTDRSGTRSSKSAVKSEENKQEDPLDEDPLYEAIEEEEEAGDGDFEVQEHLAQVQQGSQRQDRERDPMRDRINMLIKQKLDDRGKGKLTHVKREVRETDAENIEYYDYNNDVNANGNSDGDSVALDYDQKQIPGQQTSPSEQGGGDSSATTAPSTDQQEPMLKKDENAAEELRQETLRAQTNCKPPKQEFISDTNVDQPSNTDKPSPNEIIPENSLPGSKAEDEGVEDVGHNLDDRNDRRDWPAQPIESDHQESEPGGIPDGRYRENEDSGDRFKSIDNDKKDGLRDPLEYSVNVHGKIDPESIDEILGTKSLSDTKDNEEKPDSMKDDTRYDDRNREGEYDSWKYDGLRDRSRSGLEQRPEDEDSDGLEPAQTYSVDKKLESRRNWRYGDSARIEEENNGLRDTFSSSQNELEKKKLHYQDTSNFDIADSSSSYLSREARLAEDSLPTMLDRSGPQRNQLAPSGGKAYLVIAPPAPASDPQVQECPKKSTCQSQSNSGSNYLALKITDDMFKGGIEQSNPAEEKITDPSLSGKTTTEWKVIKVVQNPIERSQDLKIAGEDRGDRGKDLSLNLADVVHESFVDPEEMAADFDDDDTYMRFGRDLKYFNEYMTGNDDKMTPQRRSYFRRNLQSVSTPDEIDGVIHVSEIGERPVEKYLRDKQMISEDELRKNVEHQMKKRSVAIPEEKKATDNSNKINAMSSQNDKDQMDEEKRGLTNVEEWENNIPTVQKQRLTNEGHERDIRSVKTENRNSGDTKSEETVGSETVKETRKSWDKMLTKDDVSVANPFTRFSTRLNPHGNYAHIKKEKGRDENFGQNFGKKWAGERPTNLQKFHQGRGSDHDWKRINAKGDTLTNLHNLLKNGNEKKISSKNGGTINREMESSRGEISKESNSRHYNNNEESGSESNKNTMLKSVQRDRTQKSQLSHQGQGASFLQHIKDKKKLSAISPGHHKLPMEKSAPGHSQFEATATDEENHPEKKQPDENGGDSIEPQHEDAGQKKKFKVLLAADNMEDESQMDLALHGELAGKIVERIFDQVQKNDVLKLALGPGLYRKHKSEDAVATDKIYRQGLDDDEVKHTEGMMRRVMELLGRLILDEVQRKTCASLPPDMKEFLQWILGVEDDDRQTDQVPSLPLVHNHDGNPHREDKFLFENGSGNYDEADIDELYKKVRLLKGLINEYNALTDKEKTKVQTVHDYLVRQLEVLLKYIESKQAEGGQPQGALMAGEGNILQYQNAVPNKGPRQSTISPLVNTPSILRLSNATFNIDQPSKAPLNHYYLRRRNSRGVKVKNHKNRKHKNHRRPHSDDHENEHVKHKKKGKKDKGKSEKKKAHHRKHKGRESPAYKKLIRRAAMLRKKRVANIYEDDWNPIDSGYEEPLIYSSIGELTNRFDRKTIRKREKRRDDRFKKMPNNEIESNHKSPNPRSWTDVISGKLDHAGQSEETKSPEMLAEESLHENRQKTDVLSASTDLQPWQSQKSVDRSASGYLKELGNKLADESLTPSVDSESVASNEKKRNTDTKIPSLVNDEVMLLNKREAWKNENEQQLEEVAFGKDMRGKWREKEEFEKLTKIDKKKDGEDTTGKRRKRDGDERTSSKNNSKNFPNEKKSANYNREDFKVTADSKFPVNKKFNKLESENNPKTNLSVAKEAMGNVPEELKEANEIADTREEELKKNSEVSNPNPEVNVPPIKKREMIIARKSSVLPRLESEGSAILPLLEVSEQKEKQNQAARTEKEDQKDIADQILGLESPTIVGLNTY